ncbi:DoxX family protein [Niabella ginsengisoli]|uniref:DoxX family protein n=1 Tax=Niabella ginsengisoli TaxID=522298 RepID=A0ABS9SPX6_9BACT|nr:DoxX family protein [Niabella ginsengisoli]MCH5600448.1 DoxX family protein [Niabella ginsengisoli]
MKATKITYWITTIIIFLWEGVMPALYSQSDLAKQGLSHLQYPAYFGGLLLAFKIVGSLILIIPFRHWIKDWAYAGFAFVFISAAVSHGVIDGATNAQTIMPFIFLAILFVSYYCYKKIYKTAP